MVFDLESIIFVIIGNLVVLDHSSIAFFHNLESFVVIESKFSDFLPRDRSHGTLILLL